MIKKRSGYNENYETQGCVVHKHTHTQRLQKLEKVLSSAFSKNHLNEEVWLNNYTFENRGDIYV